MPCCVKCPYLVKCFPKLPPLSISASNNFPRFSSIGAIIFSSDSLNASCSTYITAPANFHNPKYLSSLCTTTKAVEAEEVTTVVEPAELSPSIPGGPSSHNMARALMLRQPYREAVPSTRGRLHPSLLKREGLDGM